MVSIFIAVMIVVLMALVVTGNKKAPEVDVLPIETPSEVPAGVTVSTGGDVTTAPLSEAVVTPKE